MTDELIEHCNAIMRQDFELIPPATLETVHRAIFAFPDRMHKAFGMRKAWTHTRMAAEVLLRMELLQGSKDWPTSPQQVARRIVGRFEFELEQEIFTYQNGSLKEPAKVQMGVGVELWYVIKRGARKWVATLSPEKEWVHTVTVESSSFKALWASAEGQLEDWHKESIDSTRARQKEDLEKRQAREAEKASVQEAAPAG